MPDGINQWYRSWSYRYLLHRFKYNYFNNHNHLNQPKIIDLLIPSGQTGWELYVSPKDVNALHDHLLEVGGESGIGHVGGYALGNLRVQAGIRGLGAEVIHTLNILYENISFID